MARRPTGEPEAATPEDFPATSPRDLYATSDIRFVMMEIASLATKVNRLIDDVKDNSSKIDELRHQVTFVRGATWVLGGLLLVLLAILGWYFSGKFTVTLMPGK